MDFAILAKKKETMYFDGALGLKYVKNRLVSNPGGCSNRDHLTRCQPSRIPLTHLYSSTYRSKYFDKQHEDLMKIYKWYKANKKLITSPPVSSLQQI